MESVTVRGVEIPTLGLGTWPMTGEACERAVASALDLGYRHVDTAQMYDNEDAVGAAVATADVDREDVFVTTKLLRGNLRPADVRTSFRSSLDRLDTDYVDLLLIHAPNPEVPIADTVGAMNDLQADGVVRHVGVSNFSRSQLQTAMDASETPILTNQVLYHPYRDRSSLRQFCIDHDVALTAYSPLAEGDLAGDALLTDIGARYEKSAAQVALRWLVQQENVVAIPKAASPDHQRANIDVFDFALTDAEMRRISERRG